MAVNERARILRQQLERGLGRELLAGHGGARDHGAHAGPEAVEAGRQQRRDRRRDRQLDLVISPFGEHGDELFDEQGVPTGGLEHPCPRGRGERAGEIGNQRLAVTLRKALEYHKARVRLIAAPAGSPLEQLRSGDANEQDRRFPHPLGQVLDQVEKGGLGPVHILEEDDQRSVSRQCFEQASGRPEDLLAITGGPLVANRVLEALGEWPCLVAIGEQRSIGPGGGELADDLAQGPEGDALAVGHAPADENRAPVGGERGELLGEPRLADPGRPEDREHVERALARCLLEGLAQPGDLRLAADQRRFQRADRRPLAHEVAKPPGGARLGLHLLDPGASVDQSLGFLVEQDLPGGRGVLELRRRGDRVADDRHRAGTGIARQDLTGHDPHPGRRVRVDRTASPGVADLECSGHGPKRVILMGPRDPEDGDHGSADAAGDRSAVASHGPRDGCAVTLGRVAESLGIQAPDSRPMRDQDGHRLPHLGRASVDRGRHRTRGGRGLDRDLERRFLAEDGRLQAF